MGKVYDPQANLLIAKIIEHQGNSNIASIQEQLQELNYEMTVAKLELILSQLTDKKVLVEYEFKEEKRWKKRAMPPSFKSLTMMEVVGMRKSEASEYVQRMFEYAKPQPQKPIYSDFATIDAVFELVDEVAGGHYSGENGKLILPRIAERIVIPQNQMYGLIRDNAPLANMVPAVKTHVALSMGELIGEVEPVWRRRWAHARGRGVGEIKYEVLPKGTRFKIRMRLPLEGTPLKTIEAWKGFFDLIAESPIRGLGANPRAFGGRIKPVEWKQTTT